MGILNIIAYPTLNGVPNFAVGMSSSMGREEHTKRTKILIAKIVRTQRTEPEGITVLGSCTRDAERFNVSTPKKNEADRGKDFINPNIPPINHWGRSSFEPVVPGKGVFRIILMKGRDPKQYTSKIIREDNPKKVLILQKYGSPTIRI